METQGPLRRKIPQDSSQALGKTIPRNESGRSTAALMQTKINDWIKGDQCLF